MEKSNKADALSLQPNYPNPFTGTTHIPFHISKAGHVNLVIYDCMSRKVEVIVNQEMLSGNYTKAWNASGLNAGVYFCTLVSGNNMAVQKFILVD